MSNPTPNNTSNTPSTESIQTLIDRYVDERLTDVRHWVIATDNGVEVTEYDVIRRRFLERLAELGAENPSDFVAYFTADGKATDAFLADDRLVPPTFCLLSADALTTMVDDLLAEAAVTPQVALPRRQQPESLETVVGDRDYSVGVVPPAKLSAVGRPGKDGFRPIGVFPSGFFRPDGERFESDICSGSDLNSVAASGATVVACSSVGGSDADAGQSGEDGGESMVASVGSALRKETFGTNPEYVRAQMQQYRPRTDDLSSVEWVLIRPKVLEAVEAMLRHDLNVQRVLQYLQITTRLIVQLHLREGQPLDLTTLFHPENVERFAQTAKTSSPTNRRTWRTLLRQMGVVISPHPSWGPPATPIGRSQIAPPYTEDEVEFLIRMTNAEHRPALRELGQILMALGLGAGADGHHLPYLKGSDLIRRDDTMYVRLRAGHEDERIVPVLPGWQKEIERLAEKTPADALVLGSANRINSQLTKLKFNSATMPNSIQLSRLRSTYIVGLIDANVPVRAVLFLSGLGFSSRLAYYAGFAREYSYEAIDAAVKAVK